MATKKRANLKMVASGKSAKVENYKTHRAGSRKGAVRRVFDTKGREAAVTYGRMRRLKSSTLANWVNTWGRESAKGKRATA